MTRTTALVVAPGRGTYNKDELGYLAKHHSHRSDLIAQFDAIRTRQEQETISALDGSQKYSRAKYSGGDNASGLIYACAYADFQSLRDDIDVVAVTGNSMGWYIALACAGAVSAEDGFNIVNTMGTFMHGSLIGGQMIYPFVDAEWGEIPGRKKQLLDLIDETPNLFLSIELGGMLVFAGDEAALATVEEKLPRLDDRFPMRLGQHSAFHTPMQAPIAAQGRQALPNGLFHQPSIPIVDGRGHVWYPGATNTEDLWAYTLGHQVTETYDFTRAVQNGVKEFAPDIVIVLGPGTTLGGATAQSLIAHQWRGLTSKSEFSARQKSQPLIFSMGMDAQRRQVCT